MRFYDPRILGTYIDAMTAEEATRFFGPIEAFFLGAGQDGAATLIEAEGARPPWPRVSTIPVIRQEQEAAFTSLALDGFIDRQTKKDVAFEGTIGRRRLTAGIESARGYGIVSETAVEGWLSLTVRLGDDFEKRHAWIRTELERPLPEDVRMRRIEARLRAGRFPCEARPEPANVEAR